LPGRASPWISSFEKLGAGESIETVLESHPRLTREGVLAALRFAAQARAKKS